MFSSADRTDLPEDDNHLVELLCFLRIMFLLDRFQWDPKARKHELNLNRLDIRQVERIFRWLCEGVEMDDQDG